MFAARFPPLPLSQPLGNSGEKPAEGAGLGGKIWADQMSQHCSTRRPKSAPLTPLATLMPELCRLSGQIWAPSTWKDRVRLWRRFIKWCADRSPPLKPSPLAAALFVTALPILDSSRATYASSLASVFTLLDPESTPRSLLLLARGLRAGDPRVPKGAVPCTEEQILRVSLDPSPLSLPLLMAWKSAARLGEVLLLTADHIPHSSPRSITIAWRKLPKGRRHSPWRTSSVCVLEGRFVPLLAAHIERIKNQVRPRNTPPRLFPFSSRSVVGHLRTVSGSATLTGHSLKKGASSHLLSLEPPVCPIVLSRLLKHSSGADPTPKTTIRYAGDVVRLARWLGTAALTSRL